MPSLKDMRARMNSVRQTRKITSAMKLVAASKLRRAQEQAEASRPFAERMTAMLQNLAAGVVGLPDAPPLLAGTGKDEVHLLIVATADRGLCGGFNSSIVRGARRRIQELLGQGKQVKLIVVGKKARDMLRRDQRERVVEFFDGIVSKRRIEFVDAQRITERVLELYAAGEFDVCTLVYNKFKSAVSQILTFQQLVPVQAAAIPEGAVEVSEGGALYEFEPDEELDEELPVREGL
jgi:F-type H+-transporting ATPase subunit gamma